MNRIHPSAVVEAKAELGEGVEVGPLCYVGAQVRVGEGCLLGPRVTLLGPSEFGARNAFYPGCVLGAPPQDLKYKGGPTRLVVGSDNIFREHVTAHRGTEIDTLSGGVTCIGNHNLIMVGVHIAHDVSLGNHLIVANNVQFGGHIVVEDCAVIGGVVALHQFVTVGRHAYIAGMARILHDVPPYMKVFGYEQAVRGVNVEGLRRWRLPAESIRKIGLAARLLYARRGERSPLRTREALREIEANGLATDEHVRYLVEFLKRKLEVGVFGRVRASYRVDRPEDREAFYAGAVKEGPHE
jgi:UDP-N-acetylglucosamine acyltransferase